MTDLDITTMSDEALRALDVRTFDEVPASSPEALPAPSEVSSPANTSASTDVSPADSPISDTPLPSEERTLSPEFVEGVTSLLRDGFTANGRTVHLNSVEEMQRVLQRGFGYTKRMESLKPKLQMIASLEANGVTPDNFDYLIELYNKKPEAIGKLIRESGLNPLDIPTDKVDYAPSSYRIPDAQYALQEVLESNQHREGYAATLAAVQSLDTASRGVFAARPELFTALVSDMETKIGNTTVYADIMGIVESERLKGNFEGVSALDAYVQVADIIGEQFRGSARTTNTTHNGNLLANHFINRNSTITSPRVVTANPDTASNGMPARPSGVTPVATAAKAAALANTPSRGVGSGSARDFRSMTAEELRAASIYMYD